MKDIDQLLKDNRVEMYIQYDFRGIAYWSVALFECLINNLNDVSEQQPKFKGQFLSYAEMRKAIIDHLKS